MYTWKSGFVLAHLGGAFIKVKIKKTVKWLVIALLLLLMVGLFRPTWTPKISGENGISELREVEVNKSSLEIMVRGNNRNNPIVLFVHGGP